MKQILKLVTIFVILFAAGTASALQPVVVGLNDDVHFDYKGFKANDFHIEGIVYSAQGVTPEVTDIIIFGDPGTGNWTTSSDPVLTPVPGSPEQWHFSLDFETDGDITFCQWIHFGIEFNVEARNIIARLRGWWTLDGEPVAVGEPAQAPVTGFEIIKAEDPVRPGTWLRISNDSSLPIAVSQLEWVVFEDANPETSEPDSVPLADMSKNPGGVGRPGEYPEKYFHFMWQRIPDMPVPLEIPPDSFFDVFFDVVIPQGHFLLIRGRQVVSNAMENAAFEEDWGWFWEQHQEPGQDPDVPIIVAINDDVHFDYQGFTANDFHIEGVVESASADPTKPPQLLEPVIIQGDPTTGTWTASGPVLTWMGPAFPEKWKFTMDFKTDGAITFCQWIHFGFKFGVVGKNAITNLKGWWTWNGNPVVPGPPLPAQAAVTGFNISKAGDKTRLIMTNDTTIAIAVSSLQARLFDEPVPLGDMSRNGLGIPQEDNNWTNILGELGSQQILPPDSFFDVSVDLEIPSGSAMVVRGRQVMVQDDGTVNTGGNWGWFWEQHQEPHPEQPPPPLDTVKWKQRPDMKTGINIFSIASHDNKPMPTVADDWLCMGGSPVSDLHFWGSYPGWKETDEMPHKTPPGVEAFKIQIYADVPSAGADDFSRPGRLLYETWVRHFFETYVATIPLPWGTAQEPAFEHKYRYDLDLPRIFWQKKGQVYWLNISAVPIDENFPWGWENSMDRWNDAAVQSVFSSVDTWRWEPLYHPYFETPLDMSVELTTCRGPVKWLQFPDMTEGRNILSSPEGPMVADDFLCTNGEPVTEIHFWGSYLTRDGSHWQEDQPKPPAGSQPPKIQAFDLRFYHDVPAGIDPDMPWSHPAPRGQIYQVILAPEQVRMQYWDSIPHSRTDASGAVETWWEHKYHYAVDLKKEPLIPFNQEKGTIYWLSVSAFPDCGGIAPCYFWGWETSSDHWNDTAVRGGNAFWQALGGSTFIGFEDLTVGAAYPVGSVLNTGGVSFSIEAFQASDGTWTTSGSAMVSNSLLAGGTGKEIMPNNVNLKLNIGSPLPMLDLLFGEYGGNLNLSINGDFRNFNNFADIHNSVVGGVLISAAPGLGNDKGSLHLQGMIHAFTIGGQELWIDNIHMGKTDMAFLLMTRDSTPYCRADFDRDQDVDLTDLDTFSRDFGRADCTFSGTCAGDLDYDGDVDGRNLHVIATELTREDCPCGIMLDLTE